jgi:hypothetical protein
VNGRIAFLLASGAVLAFACGPRPHGGDGIVTHNARPKAHEAVELSSRLAVNVNDGVAFDFTVTNSGAKKVEVNFPSGQTHELVVLDTLGREVWRWSNGRMFTQSLQNKVLRSSDTLAWEERWRNAPAGRYVAVATLASQNFPVTQRAEFIVR